MKDFDDFPGYPRESVYLGFQDIVPIISVRTLFVARENAFSIAYGDRNNESKE